ncbi:MAG: hypothetical protein K2K02_04000, partial [Ruminococcus sp.]|nr:hypothetical protein [Ruminococcus sp.]
MFFPPFLTKYRHGGNGFFGSGCDVLFFTIQENKATKMSPKLLLRKKQPLRLLPKIRRVQFRK